MIRDEYSPYKVVHHPEKIAQLKNKQQTYPIQVQLVPTNECCQSCTFCAYRMKDYPSNERFNDKDTLSYEKIVETLDCMKEMNVKAIHITGGGEPLVHPRIYDIFKATNDKTVELALVSNGQLLTEQMCELLGNASWVRISIDCFSPKLYAFLRNVHQNIYDRVINNIKLLVKYRQSCILGIGFVVERENYKEIYDAAKFFKDIGVDNFRISAAFTPMGYEYFSGFEQEARDLAKRAESLSDNNFTVFNLFNDRVRDCFEGTQNYAFCPTKELLTYVGADYNVYTCCTFAYNSLGYIGSIKNQSFKQLWDSDQKQMLFAKHVPAQNCKCVCMYKNKNDFINYCIKRDARHINFI